jgi:hypothetical protein
MVDRRAASNHARARIPIDLTPLIDRAKFLDKKKKKIIKIRNKFEKLWSKENCLILQGNL